MIPRGIGSMFSMLIVGQVARAGYNNRRLIGFAYILMTIGLWQMAHWTLGVSTWQIVIAGSLHGGCGLGIVFPILLRRRPFHAFRTRLQGLRGESSQ